MFVVIKDAEEEEVPVTKVAEAVSYAAAAMTAMAVVAMIMTAMAAEATKAEAAVMTAKAAKAATMMAANAEATTMKQQKWEQHCAAHCEMLARRDYNESVKWSARCDRRITALEASGALQMTTMMEMFGIQRRCTTHCRDAAKGESERGVVVNGGF